MKSFAFELRSKLGRELLSRQAIYEWESVGPACPPPSF
jgi:hypothetical protein